ncbi:MAG: hypothetical protein GC168_16685 [Candidatus Hydrogenedens sp.]|nr:hypothetical protein [Candidatus Hydrogenedens sp.]
MHPHILRFCSFVILLATGCATTHNEVTTAGFHTAMPVEPSIEKAARMYTQTCVLDNRESNNCAHFLSDAFIRAGYTELLDSPLISERCAADPKARPTRAQDMLAWFQHQATRFSDHRPEKGTGYWAGYQEKPGGHHVFILDADTGRFYGTADCAAWPVQWFYQW